METKIKKLITHSGSFHTDDIFAAAALSILLERDGQPFEIIRTRDPEVIQTGDYVFDVGGIYDEAANRFDHHQAGGAGKGTEGIEYSSFGLVWKKFGYELCGGQKAADIIAKKLAAPVDAWDNGFDLVENKYPVTPYYIQHFFMSMQPTWRETGMTNDEMFFKCVEVGKVVLEREMAHAKDFVLAEETVLEAYKRTEDKRIIVLDKNYPSEYVLISFPEPLYVVYPRSDNTWGVKAVGKELKSFKNRKDLPASWAGLKDEELQKATGVADAVFCHRALFMCVAKSKEGAVRLAELALE